MPSWLGALTYCLTPQGYSDAVSQARERGIHISAEEYGLSEQEWFSIYAYTLDRQGGEAGPFRLTNLCLRYPGAYGFELEQMMPFVHEFSLALTKLPVFEGDVFRRVDLPPDVLAEARTGRFCDPGFLSSSEEPGIFEGRDLLMIRSRSGRNIARFSEYPSEREVVFLPATAFDVTDLETHKGSAILFLEQR